MKRFSFFASHGIRWILLGVIITGLLWAQFGFHVSLPALLLTLLLMRIYYDPDRELPSYPLGVMSPVDGAVLDTDIVHDPFLDRTVRRIRIKNDLLGAYFARSPTEGKLMEFWPTLAEDHEEYTHDNTRGAIWIQTDESDDLVIVVKLDSPWSVTHCKIQAGERVGQARRCCRFPPGSLIDILLDEKTYTEVTPGKRVRAGIDRVATYNHEHLETNDVESPT